ncbi:MAG: 50S ribosomal protein L15 [Spirochaetia bacterium]
MSDFMLSAPKGQKKNRKILGRGTGSGRGKTSGKGHKGQNSRAGGGVRPGFEGGQMPLYRRVARRGFSNEPFRNDKAEIRLSDIERSFSDGDTVTMDELRKKKLVKKTDRMAKILNNGKLSKKVTISGISVSSGAKEVIEKAGGSIQNTSEQEKEETNKTQE